MSTVVYDPRECDERQEFFLKKAAQLAMKSDMTHRHGCVIVDSKTDEIISTGYNRKATHMYHTFSRHAESEALRKLKKSMDSSNLEMYVVRVGPESLGHPLKMSKPCEGCSRQILKSGIAKVYYSWSHMENTKYS